MWLENATRKEGLSYLPATFLVIRAESLRGDLNE